MKYSIFAALALAATSPALASSPPPYHIIWNPQSTALPAYTTATVIEDFSTPNVPNNTPYSGRTVPGVFTSTVDVPGSHVERAALYETVPPATQLNGTQGQYLGLVNSADYVIDLLGAGAQFFSFAFNNLTTEDHLTLYFDNGTSKEFAGFDMLNGAAIIGGNNSHDIPGQPGDWGRVSYDMMGGPSITMVKFDSQGHDLWFIDDIAFAAPEPATWAMMILGFGLAGWQLRVRRRKLRLAVA